MSDELLPYYHNELSFLRRLGNEFAEAHPKIAGRLRLTEDSSDDPHVARLIEAFAFLTARMRYKLDDDFPELTDSLLGVLYPHYTRPIPSMAIAQFTLDRAQGELTTGYTIAAGAALETDLVDGEPCRFRTTYPVTLWPAQVDSATLTGVPFTAPPLRAGQDALAVLRLALSCFAKEITFPQLALDRLRFYLKGQAQHVYQLYELLMNNVLGIALATGPRDPAPIPIKVSAIQAVGFERHEGMLPYGPQSFPGYRLLTEYFTFPEKFLFFDLVFDRAALAGAGSRLELFFYFNKTDGALERNISADTFQLGCAPMVNLYQQRAEPILLSQTQTEYRVVPDARRPLAHEVYSIDRVTATSPDQEVLEYKPFYSIKHADRRDRPLFWNSRRTRPRGAGQRADQGTEVYISLVDLGFQVTAPANWTLDVETTCLNRDLPHRAELVTNQSRFHITEGGPISKVTCLTPPTPTHRPASKSGALWRLISHLSVNHLSLVDNEEGAAALREILKLYNFTESSETRSNIEGVVSLRSRRVVGRAGQELAGGFCRGCEITVQFDEDRFSGSGVYLLAAVLDRFFALYCSINSFTKLVATTNRRDGVLRRWPPRSGDKILL